MTRSSYLSGHGTRVTPQSQPMRHDQVANSEGAFVWGVDKWTRLRRFLILGSEGGSYYASERKLTRENVDALRDCVASDGPRTVREIVEVSREGRAPKNDQAVFALAYAAGAGDLDTRREALSSLSAVCRTGTHLFQFSQFVTEFRGWGRSLRRAVGEWYAEKDLDQLAYQVVKYRQRDGVSHRDLLRLSHPGSRVSAGNPRLEVSDEKGLLFDWIVGGMPMLLSGEQNFPRVVQGYVAAQESRSPERTAEIVREFGLPHEALLSEHLGSPVVWEALLDGMPMTALIRNLGRMSANGLLVPGSDAVRKAVAQLGDGERIRKARVHPIQVLMALRTYRVGQGMRGKLSWSPVAQVVDALDAAFYTAFGNVKPSGKRYLLALDVSSSMMGGAVGGVPGLSPRDASAAMALVTAATEEVYETVGFFSGTNGSRGYGLRRNMSWEDGVSPISITPRQRLDDAIRTVSDLPFGGTDCSLPMLYASALKREIDAFVVYTDSETWAGSIHPAQALRQYREQSGIDAKLVVVGMVSNGFTIADPADSGMLDVVGFDTSTPQLISDFSAGLV